MEAQTCPCGAFKLSPGPGSERTTWTGHPTPTGVDERVAHIYTPVWLGVGPTTGRAACRRHPTHAERTTTQVPFCHAQARSSTTQLPFCQTLATETRLVSPDADFLFLNLPNSGVSRVARCWPGSLLNLAFRDVPAVAGSPKMRLFWTCLTSRAACRPMPAP